MPLVGGNELSFFSISSTICFYLVINESSIWWQQAAGCLLHCLLQRSAATQPVKPHYVSFAHTCRCNQPCKYNICTQAHSYSSVFTSGYIQHAVAKQHIIRHITSIILVILLCSKNIFLIIFNHLIVIIH